VYFPKTATELTQLTITIGTPAFQAKFENTGFQEVVMTFAGTDKSGI
jgi:hypothetical protein